RAAWSRRTDVPRLDLGQAAERSYRASQQPGTRATAATRTPTARIVWSDPGPSGSAGTVPVSLVGRLTVPRPQTLGAGDTSAFCSVTRALALLTTWIQAGRPGRVQPSGSRPTLHQAARYGRSTRSM